MNAIQRLRAERGWSQAELSYRAGLSVDTAGIAERRPENVHKSTLTCLAYAFEIKREELEKLLKEEKSNGTGSTHRGLPAR